MINSEIISKIIESNLLAASPSQLAAALKYSGRSTINRLRNVSAGDEATEEFCIRLKDLTGLSEDDLILFGRLLDCTADFTHLMKSEFSEVSETEKLSIAKAFLTDDYSLFSAGFKDLKLNRWLLMKGHEKEFFFLMLSLFLLSGKTKDFYNKHLDSISRYKLILDPLRNELKMAFPTHFIGENLTSHIFETPLAKLAYPCFLTAIRLGGAILQGYVSNYSEASMYDAMIKIDGLSDRTFWDEGENKNEVTFLKFVPVNDKGNGLYEYFTFNFLTGRADNPAQLYFYGKEEFGFFLKKERGLLFGNYSFDGTILKLILFTDRNSKSESEWRLLSRDKSERIGEIDKLFTDSYINNVKYESLGMELSCGVMISDVMVTKTKIILSTPTNERFSIPRNVYPFLKEVTPDMVPLVYRDLSDGMIYIEWEELGCRVNLIEFTKTSK